MPSFYVCVMLIWPFHAIVECRAQTRKSLLSRLSCGSNHEVPFECLLFPCTVRGRGLRVVGGHRAPEEKAYGYELRMA